MVADAERRERFAREARVAPTFVTVCSVEEAGRIHFLTMSIVEGHPRRDHSQGAACASPDIPPPQLDDFFLSRDATVREEERRVLCLEELEDRGYPLPV